MVTTIDEAHWPRTLWQEGKLEGLRPQLAGADVTITESTRCSLDLRLWLRYRGTYELLISRILNSHSFPFENYSVLHYSRILRFDCQIGVHWWSLSNTHTTRRVAGAYNLVRCFMGHRR